MVILPYLLLFFIIPFFENIIPAESKRLQGIIRNPTRPQTDAFNRVIGRAGFCFHFRNLPEYANKKPARYRFPSIPIFYQPGQLNRSFGKPEFPVPLFLSLPWANAFPNLPMIPFLWRYQSLLEAPFPVENSKKHDPRRSLPAFWMITHLFKYTCGPKHPFMMK